MGHLGVSESLVWCFWTSEWEGLRVGTGARIVIGDDGKGEKGLYGNETKIGPIVD